MTTLVAGGFVEAQHPRDTQGQFAHVPGINVYDEVTSLAHLAEQYGQEIDSAGFGAYGDRVVAHEIGNVTVQLAGDDADHPKLWMDATPDAARSLADRLESWVADSRGHDPDAADATGASPNGLVDWDVDDGVLIGYDPVGDIIVRTGVPDGYDGTADDLGNYDGNDMGVDEADQLATSLRDMADSAEQFDEPSGVGISFDPTTGDVTLSDHDHGIHLDIAPQDMKAILAAADDLLQGGIPQGKHSVGRDLDNGYSVTWNGIYMGVYSEAQDSEVDFDLAEWTHYRKYLDRPAATTAAAAPGPGVATGLSITAVEKLANDLADMVGALLRTVARKAVRLLGGGGRGVNPARVSVNDINPIPGLWGEVVDAQVLPALRDVWDQSAQAVHTHFPVGSPLPSNDAAAAYVAQAANRLVGIGDELWGHTRDSLAEGLAGDETIPELAARVQAAAGVTAPRATAIARTEVAMSANAASLATAQLLDDPTVQKVWLATHDLRTRCAHMHADGQTVPIGAPFVVGGEECGVVPEPLMFPGDPMGSPSTTINCRCSIGYSFDEDQPLTSAAAAVTAHADCTVTLCRAPLSTAPCRALVADGFDETKHPRGYHGRFGHGVGGGDVLRGLEALASVSAKLTPDPKGHHGHYDDAVLTGPPGMGSATALSEYEGLEYGHINNMLRTQGKGGRPEPPVWVVEEGKGDEWRAREEAYDAEQVTRWQPVVDDIDKAMHVSPLPHDVLVHRVMKSGDQVFGRDAWYGDVSFDDWDAGVRPDLTGASWDEHGYVSTSVNVDMPGAYVRPRAVGGVSLNSGRIEMRIRVPAGTHGVQLSPATDRTEGEILLERGLRLQVVADHGEDQDGVRLLDLEVVPSAALPGFTSTAAAQMWAGDSYDALSRVFGDTAAEWRPQPGVLVALHTAGTVTVSAAGPGGGLETVAALDVTHPDVAGFLAGALWTLGVDSPDMAAVGRFVEAEHPRDAQGKFRSVATRIADAIKAGAKAEDLVKGFDREPLRRVAKDKGITLPRGASHEHIAEALVKDAGKGGEPSPAKVKAPTRAPARKRPSVPKAPASTPAEAVPRTGASPDVAPLTDPHLVALIKQMQQLGDEARVAEDAGDHTKAFELRQQAGDMRFSLLDSHDRDVLFASELQAFNDTNREKLATQLGMTLDEFDAKATGELRQLTDQAKVATRVTNAGLESILDEGAFKTQFETQRSKALKANERRARYEQAWFGYPQDLPAEQRPFYGYLTTGPDRPAGIGVRDVFGLTSDDLSSFGTTQVVFKDSVRDRTTFNVGDSIDNRAASSPSALHDPSPSSYAAYATGEGGLSASPVLRRMDRNYDGSEFRRSHFVEAQVHSPDGKARPLTPDDIDHVLFASPPPASLRAKLDERGIPWRVFTPDSVAKNGTPEERAYVLKIAQEDADFLATELARLQKSLADAQARGEGSYTGNPKAAEAKKAEATLAKLNAAIRKLQEALK